MSNAPKIQDEIYYDNKHKNDKEVPDTAVNVLYFTNQCNLACTYCYEVLEGQPKQIMTRAKLKAAIDKAIDNEPMESQTLFVMFGGEVTLEWENLCWSMEYATRKKSNVHFNVVSNGIRWTKPKFFEEFKNYIATHPEINQRSSWDISYDGVGNKDRIYRSGKESSTDVIEACKLLAGLPINFRIRYTIQQHNYHYFAPDILRIQKAFNPKRVITSIVEYLDEEQKEVVKAQADKLRELWNTGKLEHPICSFFCDTCDGCTGNHSRKTYYAAETFATLGNDENMLPFDHFIKEGEVLNG